MKINLKLLVLIPIILFSNYTLAQEPTDCVNSVIACGNSDINLDVNGAGIREFSDSCSSNENNSVWLQVTVVTSGTLGFTLTPNSSSINEDYDFFVFGPNVDCANVGATIRCSTTNPLAAGSSNNLTGMNATENDFFEGPGENGNSFVKSLNVNAGETYFIVIDRPVGNSPFSLEWTGSANFSEPPSNDAITSGTALNLEKCDDFAPFTDGFSEFSIADNTSAILGSQTNISVTYHLTASDANIGINTLNSTYTNVRNPQTIFARITDNITGCFELTDFQLNVLLGPDFVQPQDYVLCDNLDDGNDKNGRTEFNLTPLEDEVLAGQKTDDFNVSYYTSQYNAENNIDALPNLYYNETPFNEELFIRIEEKNNSNCYSITAFNLIINETPNSSNYSLIQCDEDELPDGFTLFNLNEAINEVTGGTTNTSVNFYTDAARTNQITNNAFNNTELQQTIYIEVINNDTGCKSNSELNLEVTATDSNNAILSICDEDGIEDGLHTFNLSETDSTILNGLPNNLSITYYATLNDSALEQNPLNTVFTNTTPYSQIIYARVENANNCFGVSEVTLNVLTLPEVKQDDLMYYCLNNFPSMITIDAAILNDLPNNYTYSWSNGATTYSTQINAPGTYTVNVSNSNCSKVRTVIVEASNVASFNLPPFNINDNSENNTITIFVTGEGTYEYSLVDENKNTIAPYQPSNIFNQVVPGVYNVWVRDIKNDCGSVNIEAAVIGFPKFFTPNNDGVHDTWQIYGITKANLANTKIQIFNRHGKLIKELNANEKGWNGQLNGVKLPNEDYWFSVQLSDGRVYKNHFSLIN